MVPPRAGAAGRGSVAADASPARLNEAVLARLVHADADPARLAHHALEAGDTASVARHSVAAGRLAAAARAHREAAQYFDAALATGVATGVERAELLEAYADSAFRAYRADDALEGRRAAVRAWESLGNRSKVGENLRWQSRVASASGLRTEAQESAHAAVDVLESLPPGHELAMAYSNLSQLFMLANDAEAAVTWGGRALELGRRLGDDEATVDALNNVGMARAMLGEDDGLVLLRESFRLAVDAGLDDHAGRAALNLAYGTSRSGAATTRRPTPSPRHSGSPTSGSCSGSCSTCWRCADGSASSRTTGTARGRTP